MNQTAALFYSIGEPYAAGLFEEPDKGYFYRHALAAARYFEALPPARYEAGEMLYPHNNKFYDHSCAARPQFAETYQVHWDVLEAKSTEAAAILREFHAVSRKPDGWTHAAPNYRRILREGLASYRQRVLARPEDEFRAGLLVLLNGMEDYIRRSIAYLRSVHAPEQLIHAMEKVPFAPAETYYEGLVAWNLIAYFDGMDNLGCLDEGLDHLYAGEDYTDIIGELFDNIDANNNWSCTVGTKYNAITEQALRAIGNHRRPMLELMVRPDMPVKLWQLAIDNLRTGASNPSFYNAQGIHDMLKKHFPTIPDDELMLFCGCGCTETNLQGLTRSGGTDENISLLKIFEAYMHAHLAEADTFEAFYQGFCEETERQVNDNLDRIIARYNYMATYLPNPIRTLFTDDCIDNGKDFNAGGARYTWTQNSNSGLINVIDSLLAIRELVFRKKLYTAVEFLTRLTQEDPVLHAHFKQCPCYGVDNDDADALAADYAFHAYRMYRDKPLESFIDGYLLTEHQFDRYESMGKPIGPTPDGRRQSEPTCDSIASLRGKATEGPTAMLSSAAKLPQHLALGISVINLTLNKGMIDASLQSLVEGYFAMGGIQVQVTSVSPEDLQDAMVHPEKHQDLIVRVGGYSERFVKLTPALQKAVLERNLHSLGA